MVTLLPNRRERTVVRQKLAVERLLEDAEKAMAAR
jgi:hypothetical protein